MSANVLSTSTLSTCMTPGHGQIVSTRHKTGAFTSRRTGRNAAIPESFGCRGNCLAPMAAAEHRRDRDGGQRGFDAAPVSRDISGGGSVTSSKLSVVDGSMGRGMELTATGNVATKKHGLTMDSVSWASSRMKSRSTPSDGGRRGDGAGQAETIRRLVHMGLFSGR